MLYWRYAGKTFWYLALDLMRRANRNYYALWIGVLLVASGMRFIAPDWDGGIAAHPDERFLLDVAHRWMFFHNPCLVAHDFPYGSLPLALARLLVLVSGDTDSLYVSRLVSGLVGILLVALGGAIGRLLAGNGSGLITGVVAAFSPFLIQQAHFYTVDPLAALFVTAAVLAAAYGRWWIAGALWGLSIACKAFMVIAGMPMVIGMLFVFRRRDGVIALQFRYYAGPRDVAAFVGAAIAVFVIVAPWSFLTPVACWRGPAIQGLMVSGKLIFPYTQQYVGTVPYLYPLVQMALWGIGPISTLLGVLGLVLGAIRGPEKRLLGSSVVWLWPVLGFLCIGGLFVKFPRYMLPLYPWWIAWSVYGALAIGNGRRIMWRGILVTLLVVTTALLGLAQVGVYASPHPWIAASRWLDQHLASGTTIGIEAWDHPLPVPLVGGREFNQIVLPVYESETPGKANELLQAEKSAVVIIIASRRAYGALGRQPERFAATLAWYRRILTQRTVYFFTRCPRIGPVAFTDDPLWEVGFPPMEGVAARCQAPYALRLPRLDESFRVYDAPLTLLLVRPGMIVHVAR